MDLWTYVYINAFDQILCLDYWLITRVFQKKTLFQENQKYSLASISLGVSLKGSKGFFDLDKV